VALTAVVHFLNNLFKLTLVGRHADWKIVLYHGLPAIVASFLGAWVLLYLSDVEPVYSYTLWTSETHIMPAKLVVGLLLLIFAMIEIIPRFRGLTFSRRYMLPGGMLSGFFGGLSGMQGAIRSAFLARAGLSKEALIATGVVIACLVDLSRLGVYSGSLVSEAAHLDYGLLMAAVVAAFLGAIIGNAYLKKITMPGIQRIVASMLFIVAIGLISGVL
jgi:hypothetical protein